VYAQKYRIYLVKAWNIFGRVPTQVGLTPFCFGSGYTLQVLIRYAHCGLSAAIPHACARVYVLRE